MSGRLAPAMQRFEAEPTLFAAKPTRLALGRVVVPVEPLRSARINVHRNHAIEPILALAEPYLAYARLDCRFELHDYDDTLAFARHAPADLELVHLDLDRYAARMSADEVDAWLTARLRALRGMSSAPIVLTTFGESSRLDRLRERLTALPDVHLGDLGSSLDPAPATLVDERTASVSGTRIAGSFHPIAAREIACWFLPASLLPPVKALALDLDETLYRGVLGEDGPEGIVLSDAHRDLQAAIVALRARGVFLAVVSKNTSADVAAMFRARSDFPLAIGDFSALEVGWNDKATALASIARALRIGPDAMLFVDDNPGELADVATRLPSMRSVHANADASITQRAILFHPGVFRWTSTRDDGLRVRDLEATVEREALLASVDDPATYFQSLEVTIGVHVDPTDRLDRLAELSKKTNQFNLALARLSAVTIRECIERSDAIVVGVELRDRLSDSGLVASIVAIRDGDRLIVEELCVSCRAMGRHLEDSLILPALLASPLANGCSELAFRVAEGERNEPARAWLRTLLGASSLPGAGLHPIPFASLRGRAVVDGIRFEHRATTPS